MDRCKDPRDRATGPGYGHQLHGADDKSHRIARPFQSLLRLLRRPGRDTGSRSPQAARPVAVPGIGLGSLGMPPVDAEVAR